MKSSERDDVTPKVREYIDNLVLRAQTLFIEGFSGGAPCIKAETELDSMELRLQEYYASYNIPNTGQMHLDMRYISFFFHLICNLRLTLNYLNNRSGVRQ